MHARVKPGLTRVNGGSACRTFCTRQRGLLYGKHRPPVVVLACVFGVSGTGAPVLDVAVRSADRSLLTCLSACQSDVPSGSICNPCVSSPICCGFVSSCWPGIPPE